MSETQTNDPAALEPFYNDVKSFRKDIDAVIVRAEKFLETKGTTYGREMSLVRTKLQEAKMWAGKVLEVTGRPFPAELADKAD